MASSCLCEHVAHFERTNLHHDNHDFCDEGVAATRSVHTYMGTYLMCQPCAEYYIRETGAEDLGKLQTYCAHGVPMRDCEIQCNEPEVEWVGGYD